MGLATKRLKFIILSFTIFAVVIAVCVIFPTNTNLIMTPSTHEKIVFLHADASKFQEGVLLRFAIHDLDCDYVQFCFSVSKQDTVSFDGSRLQILVDDNVIEKYSIISRTTWKRKYVMILISDIHSFSNIKLISEGTAITIT